MHLRKWDDLPKHMQCHEVQVYYNCLKKKKYILIFKRVFDIIISILLIAILFPILLGIAIWIKLDSKGTVFYKQIRITQYGKEFNIFKFRTMISDADKIGTLITVQDDIRITNVGKIIRKCRLDELPQLFNVLLGDMSFVGARPEVKKYVEIYTNEMYATLLLPAGITSLASLLYRDEDKIINRGVDKGKTVSQTYLEDVLPKKMEYNLKYLKEISFFLDLKLMIKTILR